MSYLGLAQRAGRIVSGTDAVHRELDKGVCLLIVARDASERTARHWNEYAAGAGVPLLRAGTCAALGSAIGKSPKAVVAVTEEGFCAAITKAIEQQAIGAEGKTDGISRADGRDGRSTDRSDA